jgi:hypothetical protein
MPARSNFGVRGNTIAVNPYLEEGRIARSGRLIGIAWRVVRRDRAMLALAALAAVANIVGCLLIMRLAGWRPGDHADQGRLLLVAAISAYPLTFISVFLNVAVAAAASEALEGRRIGLLDALGIAAGRIGQIALWSALAAGVGVLLQELASRLPAGGRLASWLLGAAWSLVTLFAIPILALEGCGAVSCVKRSATLMRERWGEGLTGTVAVNAAFTIAGGAFGLLLGVGGAMTVHDPGTGFALVAAGLVGLMLCATAANAVRQVFAVALYRYATTGEATGGFPKSDLQHPTRPKKRLFRRRHEI